MRVSRCTGYDLSIRTGECVTGTFTVNVAEDIKMAVVEVRLNSRYTYVADAVIDYAEGRFSTPSSLGRHV